MKIYPGSHKQPDALASLDWWVPTARNAAGVKLPRAPYLNDGSYPAEWSADLQAEKRPERSLTTVKEWADLSPSELRERGAGLPTAAEDSTLRVGLILPTDRLPPEIRPVLIDWDDVRDPETGEIHPVCAEYLRDFGGYVDVSVSGKGVHQWVFGEIPDPRRPDGTRKKFIKAIDTEPFVDDSDHAEDVPQVELYDGGRHVIMTGRHVERFGDDVVPGQELLDGIVERFGGREKSAPETQEDGEHGPDATTPSDSQADGDISLPLTSPEDKPLCYHRALRARETGEAYTNNHDTNLLASNLALNLGYDVAEALGHFETHSGAGFDRSITEKALKGTRDRAEADELHAPGTGRLKEAGILPPSGCDSDCPLHGNPKTAEHVAVLPDVSNAGTDSESWGSLNPERPESAVGLTQQEARDRTSAAIESAFEHGNNRLIDALPTLGKSFGAVRAAAETEQPTTILTNRGREEQYEQYTEWADERGLSTKTLPSVWRTCGCFTGDHGQEIRDTVRRWYRRGATGKEIHVLYESATGVQIPCEHDGSCGFKQAWEGDFDEYDILLGSYVHGYVSSAVNGRTVVIDEYPRDAFETVIGSERLSRAISSFLSGRRALPFADMTDLLENRSDDMKRAKALEALGPPESNGEEAILNEDGHADVAAAVYTLLATAGPEGEQYDNGWERATIPRTEGDVGAFDRENGSFHLLRRPVFTYARNVVALDGTPSPRLWHTVQRKRLKHTRILSDVERREYLNECLNMTFVQTTDAMKPYNSRRNVWTEQDATLLEAIEAAHAAAPALISTLTGVSEYEDRGLFRLGEHGELVDSGGLVSAVAHYGNLKGSNRFKTTRLGAVFGSNHFGDGFIQKWGAFAGAEVDRDPENNRGAELRYVETNPDVPDTLDGIGQAIYRDMTEGETLQAALRFGRDGRGATVYLHTAALPPLLSHPDVARQGRVLSVYSDGKVAVLESLGDMDTSDGVKADVVAEGTELSARHARRVLGELVDDGILEVEPGAGSRPTMWFDPGGELQTTPERGHASLPNPVPKDGELTDAPGAEERDGDDAFRFRFETSHETVETVGGAEAEAEVVKRGQLPENGGMTIE